MNHSQGSQVGRDRVEVRDRSGRLVEVRYVEHAGRRVRPTGVVSGPFGPYRNARKTKDAVR